MEKLKVVIKNVGQEAEPKEIENKLSAMQEIVGGYIERVALPHNIDMWVNEEGKLQQLPINLFGTVEDKVVDVYVGNVFFTSHDEEGNAVDLNDFQLNWIWARLREGGHATHEGKAYKFGILAVRK